MNYKKLLAVLSVFGNTIFAAAASSNVLDVQNLASPAGTRYYVANGTTFITRFPDRIEFAGKSSKSSYDVSHSINDVPIRGGTLRLSVNQTEEEFIEALSRAGVFSREDDAKRKRDSNWTRTFLIDDEDIPVMRHCPEFIEVGSKRLLSYRMRMDDGAAAELSLFQTEEEFTGTLIHHGLLNGIVTGMFDVLPHDTVMLIPVENRYYLKGNRDFVARFRGGIVFNYYAFYDSVCFPEGVGIGDTGSKVAKTTTLAGSQSEAEFLSSLESLGLFDRDISYPMQR